MKYKNEEKAVKELDCYMYCLYQSLEHFKKDEFAEASVYLENAARSLKELERLKVDENESNHVINIFVVSRSNNGNY